MGKLLPGGKLLIVDMIWKGRGKRPFRVLLPWLAELCSQCCVVQMLLVPYEQQGWLPGQAAG